MESAIGAPLLFAALFGMIEEIAASLRRLLANTQAIATSFKVEILNGIHALGTSVTRAGTGADTFKGALYLATATYNAATTAYSTTNEITGTNYTAGGNATVWVAPTSTSTTAFTSPNASFSWPNLTQATAFDALLIYNVTQSNKAVAVYTFGSQTVTAGTFTLTIPTNDATTGLLRIA
jgi:hypothetical protein